MEPSIKDPETFDLLLRFRSALENGGDISEFGHVLGASPAVLAELSSNRQVKQNIIEHLSRRINHWVERNSGVSDVGTLTPLQEQEFVQNLHQEMFQGKLEPRTQVILA